MKTGLTVNAIEEFKTLIENGIASIVQACEKYVEALDSDKDANEKFHSAFPMIDEATWANFELIGRKLMHHKLLFTGGKAINKLKLLPYSQQEVALEKGIDLLVSNGDILKVKPDCMTPFQIKQIFDGEHIRSLPQQKAYLESLKIIATKSHPVIETYVIKSGKVIFPAQSEYTRKEIARILMEME